MKDDQINKAIAQATGCVLIIDYQGFWVFSQPFQRDKRLSKHHTKEEAWRLCAKNYTTDLNAIHEAVRHKLQRHEMSMDDFATNLAKVIKVPSVSLALIIATAAQLSEAFLKTLDLWKP